MAVPDETAETLRTYLQNADVDTRKLLPVTDEVSLVYNSERVGRREDGRLRRRVTIRMAVPRRHLVEEDLDGIQWFDEVIEDPSMQALCSDVEQIVAEEVYGKDSLDSDRFALDTIGLNTVEFVLSTVLFEEDVEGQSVVSVTGAVPFSLEFDPDEQNPIVMSLGEPTDEELLATIARNILREEDGLLSHDDIQIHAWDEGFSPSNEYAKNN